MNFVRLRSRRAGLSLLALALLSAFVWMIARSGPLAPIRVTTVTVGAGALAPALFGIGTVEARRSYMIGPTAAGRVLRVLVDAGDPVKAGQLLVEMDPVDLEQRTAALDAALERAGSAAMSAGAQLQDARARKALAEISARRYVELGQKNFVSPSAVEVRQQEQVSAQAGASAAEANLAAARQDMARISAERDGLRQLRNNMRLLAPADGVVVARDAEPGSTLVAGQAAIRLIDPASLWVKMRIDQGRSGGLALGLPAEIVLRSNPSRPLAGKVARLELVSDNVTEERVAQVAFDRIPAGVAVGELAEITLQLPAGQSGLLLPNASIRHHAGVAGVWVRSDGALRFAPVQLDSSSLDGKVLVRQGLAKGEQVIVYSDREVGAGSRIQVVNALVGSGS